MPLQTTIVRGLVATLVVACASTFAVDASAVPPHRGAAAAEPSPGRLSTPMRPMQPHYPRPHPMMDTVHRFVEFARHARSHARRLRHAARPDRLYLWSRGYHHAGKAESALRELHAALEGWTGSAALERAPQAEIHRRALNSALAFDRAFGWLVRLDATSRRSHDGARPAVSDRPGPDDLAASYAWLEQPMAFGPDGPEKTIPAAFATLKGQLPATPAGRRAFDDALDTATWAVSDLRTALKRALVVSPERH